jgi:hypothetical protein
MRPSRSISIFGVLNALVTVAVVMLAVGPPGSC